MKTLLEYFIVCCFCALLLKFTNSSDNQTTICIQRPGDCDDCYANFMNLCNETINRLDNLNVINSTCGGEDVGTVNNDAFMEKHNTTMRRWLNFCNILDKTVMGVLLRDECMKNECMDAYKEWICMTQYNFSKINETDPDNSTPCKPHLEVCQRVVQQCPYYTPERLQRLMRNGTSMDEDPREILYGGLPAFMCPEEKSLDDDSTYATSDINACVPTR